MIKPNESSSIQVSRSSTGLEVNDIKNKIITAQFSKVDRLFIFFDEMFKIGQIYRIFDVLLEFFTFMQLYTISMWPAFDIEKLNDSWDSTIVHWIYRIFLFTRFSKSADDILITVYTVSFLFGLLILSFLVQYLIYVNTRRFFKVSLSFSRNSFYIVPTISLFPCSFAFGAGLKYSISVKETKYYIITVVSGIYLFFLLNLFYFHCRFTSNEPYLPTSHMASWSWKYRFNIFAFPCLFQVVSFIIEFEPKYFRVILILCKMIYNFYMIYQVYYFPFIVHYINSIFAANYLSIFAFDISRIVETYSNGPNIRPYKTVVSYFVIFILIFPIIQLINMKLVKSISNNLKSERIFELENIEDTVLNIRNRRNQILQLMDGAIRQHFQNLGLHKNQKKCLQYIRIGLSNHCDLFLSWSLIKYAGEFYNNTEVYLTIIQILSLFPGEGRLLSAFFNECCNMVLSFTERFVLYQVNMIKRLRQSSEGNDISEKILHLRQKANNIIDDVRKYWLSTPDDIRYYYDLHSRTKEVHDLYVESIVRFPNSLKLIEDYSHFLIEGMMDFREGVKQKNRANMIEFGRNFIMDYSFRSLINKYPDYILKEILDTKGNFILKSNNHDTTVKNGSSSNPKISSSSIEENMDPDIEESIAKECFTYPRLRLEFQNALSGRKTKYSKHLFLVELVSFLLVITITVFYYLFFHSHYDKRVASIERLIHLHSVKYNHDSAFVVAVFLGLSGLGLMDQQFLYQLLALKGSEYEINLAKGAGEVARFADYSSRNLTQYLADLNEIAKEGTNVSKIFNIMVDDNVPICLCEGLRILDSYYYEPLKSIFVRMIGYMKELCIENPALLLFNYRTCELLANIQVVDVYFFKLLESILEEIRHNGKSDDRTNLIILLVVPIVYCLLTIPSLLILLSLMLKEVKQVHNLMKNLNANTKEMASQTIAKSSNSDLSIKESMKSDTLHISILYLFCFLPLINVILFIVVPYLSKQANKKFMNYNFWGHYSASRSHTSLLTTGLTVLVIMCNSPFLGQQSRQWQFIEFAKDALNKMNDNNNNLLRGSNDTKSIVGLSKQFDDLNIEKQCINDSFIGNSHLDYECASLDGSITQLYSYLTLIHNSPSSAWFNFDSEISNAFHVMNTHIMERVWNSTFLINELANDELKQFRKIVALICVLSDIIGIIVFIILFAAFKRVDVTYKGQLQLMSRISPLNLISNQQLMNYITHKEENKNVEVMTPSQKVVYLSRDCVISMNIYLSIESINKATTDLLGYTPDQLLGQSIHSIMPNDESEEFFKQIDMMLNGQCALTYENSFSAITDDAQYIPVHVTLIGIPDASTHTPKAFVVILRDESDLLKQRTIAETAKQQSEKLLYQILPRDIVTRLNSGETDINFTVPSATIIFIDIVKFSQYSSTLTPSQIMEHLSTIFAKFDNALKKYNLITKIKLIGDVYMAAAGLFSPSEQPQKHAKEVVDFALDAQGCLEEANVQFNANLMARIGVNTGGPLIAGVLGTDKPVFDIIGDPINVAARLQSTAIPNTIQISEETYQLIAQMNYNLEKRGEVELKGKGKRMAYLVRPYALSGFFSPNLIEGGSIDSISSAHNDHQ